LLYKLLFDDLYPMNYIPNNYKWTALINNKT